VFHLPDGSRDAEGGRNNSSSPVHEGPGTRRALETGSVTKKRDGSYASPSHRLDDAMQEHRARDLARVLEIEGLRRHSSRPHRPRP